jgi:excisionase family DNA binding protein
MNDQLLTRIQAAEYLGVRAGTLASWACTGRQALPFIRVGNRIRYRRSDLEAFLEASTVRPTAAE